jgi:NADH dehydrogenase
MLRKDNGGDVHPGTAQVSRTPLAYIAPTELRLLKVTPHPYISPMTPADQNHASEKTQILILGGGFGGLYAALHLDKTLARDPDIEITLVNETNFILFTPMLHEVAASDLDMTNIVNPIRKMLRHVKFLQAIVEKIDLEQKTVTIAYAIPRQHRQIQYDKLLIAMGSETRFVDGPGLRENSVTIKTLDDAVFLRNRMIALLEAASIETDPDLQSRQLTFVVAGGGFSGVETISAMNDFLRDAMRYYPALSPEKLKIVLIHPGHVLLPEFSETLGHYTEEKLRQSRIDVRMNTKVTGFVDRQVNLDPGDPIPAATLVWAAGVTPGPVIEALSIPKEKGRITVNPCMELEKYPGVWVVGDCAAIPDHQTGKPFPATAQHAIRQGKVVGRNIAAALRGRPQQPFRYTTLGQLAAIGQRRGVANILGVNFSGFFAWFLWRTLYLSKLPRLEKKVRVALDWALDLFFSKDIVQFITPREAEQIQRPGIPKSAPRA